MLIVYNKTDVGASRVQELSWRPTVAMPELNAVDSSVRLDSTGVHNMMTLWRRGGYWAPHGESALPLVEV